MLAGQIKSINDLPDGDLRKMYFPRFSPENIATNVKLVLELEKIANRKACTPAQLALSWVRNLSKKKGMPTIIPIPGASSAERVKENAVEVKLSEEEMGDIDTVLARCEVVGDRYFAAQMRFVNG